MSAVNAVALRDYVVTLIKRDERVNSVCGVPVYVTADLEAPTMDQCPAVLVILRRIEHQPLQIVHGIAGAGPDQVRVMLEAQCWHFSGQSTGDAVAQVSRLGTAVIDALRDDPTLGTSCNQWAQVTALDYEYPQGPNAQCWFAVARVSVTVTTLR